MKFTILGFSQKKLIELGLNVDDALILRYFIDFKDSGSMIKEYIDDDMYYWVNYEKMREQLPILNISKDRIYRKLKNLVNVNVLKHKTKKNGGTFSFYAIGNNYKNLIMDSEESTDGSVKITEGFGKNNGACMVKITEGYGENNGTKYSSIKDTSINNSSINNICKEVIDHLNKTVGSNFKYNSKETQKLIKARLKDGFSIDDFKKVIDSKYAHWKNTEYAQYLVPSTLFAGKFETYLNQKVIKPALNSNCKPSTFNSSSQRTYDFDSLEKKLLGWDKKEDE